MSIQLLLSILYLVALTLPAFGICKALLRAAQEHKRYEHSDREEERITEKYRLQVASIEERRKAVFKDSSQREKRDEIIEEERELKEKIRLEEEAHGVDRMTYERFEEAVADAVRNFPKRNYLLRVDEAIFVGVGIFVGTTASIWSLWI